MEGTGLTVDDYEPEPVEVWPENAPAFDLFCYMQTQWRVSTSGASGLDYNVMYRELDDLGLKGEDRRQIKDDIRTMEFAALAAMSEKD